MTITKKTLEAMVNRLNAINGIENANWNTLNSFRLSKDGVGYSIQKVVNDCGGISNVGGCYGMTTKECYFFLSGLLANL